MARGIRLLLVDALNLIRRVWAAQPGDDELQKTREGRVASAQSLRRALRETSPTHAVCVFEGRESGWRHELHPGYKEGHSPMPVALQDALLDYQASFFEAGVVSFRLPAQEADDIIATMATKVAKGGGEAVILSTDAAFLQLLGPRIRVRDHFDDVERDAEAVRDRYGVGPGRLIDFFALVGNTTNGIPGVPGIGPKTAASLLEEHGDLDSILAAAGPIGGKVGESLAEHAEDARLSRKLVRLKTDLDLGVNLQELRYLGDD